MARKFCVNILNRITFISTSFKEVYIMTKALCQYPKSDNFHFYFFKRYPSGMSLNIVSIS